ncbi:unnamed protein product, partial [Vitis vinifera]
MERLFSSLSICTVPGTRIYWDKRYVKAQFVVEFSNKNEIKLGVQCNARVNHRKPTKNLPHPRRAKLPPEPEISTFLKGGNSGTEQSEMGTVLDKEPDANDDGFLRCQGSSWIREPCHSCCNLKKKTGKFTR